MNSKLFFLFAFLTAIVNACIDPYYPEIDKYENKIAISGLIDNEPGPYYIHLQHSTTIYFPEFTPLSNATVYVADNLGNVENFYETEEGVYSNTSPGFQGIIGRSYQLTVIISEDQIYNSSWEKIQEPLGIESVYAEIEDHIDPNFSYNLLGYQFYLNTEKTSNNSTYLMWKLQSTYKYKSDFKCWQSYSGRIEPFPRPDSLMTCWKTEIVPRILIGTTQGLLGGQLIKYPLHYVSSEGRELSIRYSLLVNQYVVSETVYNYWKALQDQNDIQGSLYTQQPYQIRGNMENMNNPGDPVAGCFVAAGVSKKRVYYNRPPIKFNYPFCELGDNDYDNMQNLFSTLPSEWPIYLTMGTGYRLAYPNQECIDCRKSGGKLEKPDYWTDN
jgi:hypothetical protein